MWIGRMTISQVEELEKFYAKLTEYGWVFPRWLVELRKDVEKVNA